MRKAFLRAPVDFSRISSSFNMRRKHPPAQHDQTTGDWCCESTPILAAGEDALKLPVAPRPTATVVIRHGEQFVTKYLHLSKFARNIKKGRKVKQGQTIGYVGSTGWATGPHLHYEFLVNAHQNPRTVKLPEPSRWGLCKWRTSKQALTQTSFYSITSLIRWSWP